MLLQPWPLREVPALAGVVLMGSVECNRRTGDLECYRRYGRRAQAWQSNALRLPEDSRNATRWVVQNSLHASARLLPAWPARCVSSHA